MPKHGKPDVVGMRGGNPKGNPNNRPVGGAEKGKPKFWPGNNGKIGGEKPPHWPGLGGGMFKGLEQLMMLQMLAQMMGGGDEGGHSSTPDYGAGNTFYGNPATGQYSVNSSGQVVDAAGNPIQPTGNAPASPSGSITNQMTSPYITPDEVAQAQARGQQPTSDPTALMFPPPPIQQTQPGPNGYTPSPTAGGDHRALNRLAEAGVPADQIALAEMYGKAFNVDPLIGLAIAQHETQFGTKGRGRPSEGGFTLGYGAEDHRSLHQYGGTENQYSNALRTLAERGVHSIDDLKNWHGNMQNVYGATDPHWTQGVVDSYQSLLSQLGGGSPLAPEPPQEVSPTSATTP